MRQHSSFLRRLARNEAGNTLAVMAAAMIPFTILVGSGLDLAVTYMARGKLQNACDAGVLAARQAMQGTDFTTVAEDGDASIEAEAHRFFDFNFPVGTAGTSEVAFEVVQDEADDTQLLGTASASVPTSLMRIIGVESLPIAVACDAKRDMGHNDIMLVLDVTGSMADPPSNGGGTKIGRLREGAAGIFRGLQSDDGSIIRFGIVPYSHTVNVARSLQNKDILKDQWYVDVVRRNSVTLKLVNINRSSWNNGQGGGESGNTQAFRTSGDGCIEERPSFGKSMAPFEIENTITREDVDEQAGNAGNQPELQFGRYDPGAHTNNGWSLSGGVRRWRIDGGSYGENVQVGCPAEATKLRTYDDEGSFQAAINSATARVTGGTYHDVGMLWGLRFISRTGYFASENPAKRDDEIPVNQHIVFMTDGMLDTGDTLYSAHGIEKLEKRTLGSGFFDDLDDKHLARFEAACDLAKSMKITVWVIALDVADTGDVEACATSADHFYTSDGSDLEEIFEEIGRGIGNLRLTR